MATARSAIVDRAPVMRRSSSPSPLRERDAFCARRRDSSAASRVPPPSLRPRAPATFRAHQPSSRVLKLADDRRIQAPHRRCKPSDAFFFLLIATLLEQSAATIRRSRVSLADSHRVDDVFSMAIAASIRALVICARCGPRRGDARRNEARARSRSLISQRRPRWREREDASAANIFGRLQLQKFCCSRRFDACFFLS